MHKRPIPKRKVKQTLNKALFLGVIFISTLGFLMLFYLLSTLKKHPILNPASFKTSANQTIQNTNPDLIKELLEKQNIAVNQRLIASDSSSLIILENGAEIIFSEKKNIQQQIASLQLIMRQITIEGRRFKKIDFRFDNPVISF